MKKFSFLFVLVCAFAFGAKAEDVKKVSTPVKKVCFFSYGDYGSKGDRLYATVSAEKLVVKDVADNGYTYGGSYKGSDSVVNGKDGKTYLDFDYAGEEGCSSVLVDEVLLRKNTKGNIKFRCRGEGFSDTVFFCVDPRQ